MNEVTSRPEITPLDRLGLTLCLAVIAHAIVILGVTFTAEGKPKPSYNTMEIVLVQQKSEKPKDAKLLAQANLKGGGETAKDVTPATPLPPPFPDNQANLATRAPASPPQKPPQPKAVDEKKPETKATLADTRQTLAVERKKAKTSLSKQRDIKKNPQTAAKEQPEIKKRPKQPTAAQLLANSYKIASLSAEIDRRLKARAERPRRTFISASTQEYKYAAYMEAWRAKVERVGNLNYPEEAQRRDLSGSLILDVALNPDGSVHRIIVRRSSGFKVLDDAAIRIVKLASPFAPFPPDIRKETDILHITRTWQFLANSSFR